MKSALSRLCQRHRVIADFGAPTKKPEGGCLLEWSVILAIGTGTEYRQIATKFYSHHAPTAADVLSSLLLDASGAENASNFEDWAREYSYDTDSRKAEAIYRRCLALAPRLRKFLGPLYERFARAEH